MRNVPSLEGAQLVVVVTKRMKKICANADTIKACKKRKKALRYEVIKPEAG